MQTLIAMTAAFLLAGDDVGKADLAKLQGTWQLALMEREGNEATAEDIKDWTAEYDGNRLILRAGNEVRRRGIITLEPSRKPRAINTWDQNGPYEDQTVPGIYDLDGDTLKVCFAKPGAARPTQFTTKAGSGLIYCVYKRKKP